MKKMFLMVAVFLMVSATSFGQKYAYIDSEYILSNMPEYTEAQAELDRIAVEWQKEIEAQFKKIDSMYKKYQVEAITLLETMKQKRENAIIAAEAAAKDLQKKRFGKDRRVDRHQRPSRRNAGLPLPHGSRRENGDGLAHPEGRRQREHEPAVQPARHHARRGPRSGRCPPLPPPRRMGGAGIRVRTGDLRGLHRGRPGGRIPCREGAVVASAGRPFAQPRLVFA